MTAHAMKGDDERCLAAGMDGYVSKPIDARSLFQAIESLIVPGAEATSVGDNAARPVRADGATAVGGSQV
jgi:CheY-like chemotaxis protein